MLTHKKDFYKHKNNVALHPIVKITPSVKRGLKAK